MSVWVRALQFGLWACAVVCGQSTARGLSDLERVVVLVVEREIAAGSLTGRADVCVDFEEDLELRERVVVAELRNRGVRVNGHGYCDNGPRGVAISFAQPVQRTPVGLYELKVQSVDSDPIRLEGAHIATLLHQGMYTVNFNKYTGPQIEKYEKQCCDLPAANVRLDDNTDWWSNLRRDEDGENIPEQERKIGDFSLQILGVRLDKGLLASAQGKFGAATIVERGDASRGRDQVCFASAGKGKKTYLIFETGEIDYGFYLFSDDKPWSGRDRCAESRLVSAMTSTGSGLRLGLTPTQVTSILGKPSQQRSDRLIYALHKRVKLSPREAREQRSRYPDVSDEEFRKNYEAFDWSAGIELKFVDSKLVFMSISVSETF